MTYDILLASLPSALTAIAVITIFSWLNKRKQEREKQEHYRIVSAEIQFNEVYADIFAERSKNLDAEPDYTPFVIRADKPVVKENMCLDRYWTLVEMYIHKTEQELRDELELQNSRA